MKTVEFRSLCASIGSLDGCTATAPATDNTGRTTFSMSIRSVAISLRHRSEWADKVTVIVEFGPLPAENTFGSYRSLTDVNTLMLWVAECSIGCDPETGVVSLTLTHSLDQAKAPTLYSWLCELAEIALDWRLQRPARRAVLSPASTLLARESQR